MNAQFQRMALAFLSLLFLFTIAWGTRLALLEAQYQQVGEDLPFTLESALFYRRVKMVYDTGRLPAHDAMVQYPEGINPRTTYTVGAEYVYAALARFFPSHVPVAKRIRWIESGVFSLSIPLLALGLYAWRKSISASVWASLFYALSISSVLRSTGQELSHENSAFPLLIAHWALSVWAGELRRSPFRLGVEAASAVLLALALCAWDLIQFYIALRLIARAWRICRASPVVPRSFDSQLWLEYAALLCVGFWNPYHHAQGWLTSTTMGLAHGIAVVAVLSRRPLRLPYIGVTGARVLILFLVLFLTAIVRRWYAPADAYGHFAELLWAKIRYLNIKPEDPGRLTFNQRILWVPALNSTDCRLAFALFPALFGLTIPAVLLVFRQYKKSSERVGELLFAWAVSAVAFWLFFRFHVFLSLFSCILLGVAWSCIPPTRLWLRWTAGLIVGAGLFTEAIHTLQRPGQWGRVNVYFKELNELTHWLERNAAPDAVLANFGVSGSIAAYGKCAIILHPKFENVGLRERVREYGERLFLGTEKEFRDWAVAHGAKYYVHAFGEFSKRQPELQMRYFVNAFDPLPQAAARGFEFDPDGRTWFVPLWRNVKYAVFRVVSLADESLAMRQVALAEAALAQGDLEATTRASLAALERFPRQPRALELLRIAGSLQSSGFRVERE